MKLIHGGLLRRISNTLLFLIFLSFALNTSYSQPENYYSSINPDASTFISDLKARIRNPYNRVSYENFINHINNFASIDNNNGTKSVFCVYSNYKHIYQGSFSWGTMSREHTFCQSWMPNNNTSRPEYSDQHHLFPTHQNGANAIRSNHPLGKVVNVSSTFGEAKYGTNSFGHLVYEPRDKHKGDAARALLYMSLRYDGIDGYDWSFNRLNNVVLPALNEAPQDVATLIAWHKQDPPDKWEIDRNNYVLSVQQNRNPFIDRPEFVNYINFNNLSKLSPVYATEPQNYVSSINANSNLRTITLSWIDTAAGTQPPSGYLLLAYIKDDYFLPIDGEIYSNDYDLSDGSALVNIPFSAADTFSFSNLPNGNYYFSFFSYNGDGTLINYKIDGNFPRITIAINAPLAAEPSNHVTNFLTGAISITSIELTWTDATGPQLPEGYLILASSNGIFSTPYDGVIYSDDSNLADGFARLNISFDAPNTLNFSGLNSSTTYFFKIFPFNGGVTQRNYKTDGIVPQISATTFNSTYLPNVWINEFHYDNVGTDINEFIEIAIPNIHSSPTELSKFSVVLYNGANGLPYNTKTLNQFIKGSTDTINGYSYLYFIYPSNGIENGPSDGIALGYNNSLIQFISYEGTLIAASGIASTVTSTDIGISQSSSTPVGSSIGLSGHGRKYLDYNWTTFTSSSAGMLNLGQTILPRALNITILIEALYNGITMTPDTVSLELRQHFYPYSLLETKKTFINNQGNGTAEFSKVSDGTAFYIVVKHRNSIETWSSTAKSFSFGLLNFDLSTSNNQAYGNNLKQIGTRWCIYSGDVNQDGAIDANDLSIVETGCTDYQHSNVLIDLNMDGIVDIEDLIICDNNSSLTTVSIAPNLVN